FPCHRFLATSSHVALRCNSTGAHFPAPLHRLRRKRRARPQPHLRSSRSNAGIVSRNFTTLARHPMAEPAYRPKTPRGRRRRLPHLPTTHPRRRRLGTRNEEREIIS